MPYRVCVVKEEIICMTEDSHLHECGITALDEFEITSLHEWKPTNLHWGGVLKWIRRV